MGTNALLLGIAVSALVIATYFAAELKKALPARVIRNLKIFLVGYAVMAIVFYVASSVFVLMLFSLGD